MLIRGQTTEDRIRELADGFVKGFQGYSAGQQRQNDATRQMQAQELQKEALRRQQAMDALNIEAKLTDATGRNFLGSGVGEKFFSGGSQGIEELMQAAPVTPKYEAEKAASDRQARLVESQINKNNRTQSTGSNLSYEEKLDLKNQKAEEAKTKERSNPEYKLEKLGAEGRSKVGAIASGFQALDQMVKSSDDGYGPKHLNSSTPLVGAVISDDPYTEGERITSEVIGRLQSGGAMNDAEVRTFRSLGPRPGDSSDARKRKLQQQKDFLQNKLTAYGLKTDELSGLGFETTSRYQPRSTQAPQGRITNEAPANDPRYQRLMELRAKKAGA